MAYKNLLLIDDDEDDQEIFLTALEKVNQSIHCIALDSAVEAMQKLENGQINPDLIFLDLNMPIMNGQQFLVEIKKEESLKNIPVIILSTSSHKATIELTKELGAIDFFSKPDKFEDYISLLSSVIS
jgi:CheY-like chemotaxis protein